MSQFVKLALLCVVLCGVADAASVDRTNPFHTATLPNPNEVYLEEVTYAGSGCPKDTARASFNDERTAVTVLFDQYVASAGPGIPMSENRKNCQLNVKVHIPRGYQYSVATVDYRGFVQLDPTVTALQRSAYYFAGELREAVKQAPFYGPVEKDYVFRDTFDFQSMVWSSCTESTTMNINSQIRIDNSRDRKKSGTMTTDSIDGKVKQILGITWRKC
ncbi:secreted protein [Paraphysoderma sedebokerense]|nr:secreted protein [Paraphysoderma sedebokerense]